MQLKKTRGRPPKEPDDLITVDEAVEKIKEHLLKKFNPTTAEKLAYAKGTLYNKISSGKLHCWKSGWRNLVSEKEVLKLVS